MAEHALRVGRALEAVSQTDRLPPQAANQAYVRTHMGGELLLQAWHGPVTERGEPSTSDASHLSSSDEAHLLEAALQAALRDHRRLHNGLTREETGDLQYHKGSLPGYDDGSTTAGFVRPTLGKGNSGPKSLMVIRRLAERNTDGSVGLQTNVAHESVHEGQIRSKTVSDWGKDRKWVSKDIRDALPSSDPQHPRSAFLHAGASLPGWRKSNTACPAAQNLAEQIYRATPFEMQALQEQRFVDELHGRAQRLRVFRFPAQAPSRPMLGVLTSVRGCKSRPTLLNGTETSLMGLVWVSWVIFCPLMPHPRPLRTDLCPNRQVAVPA